MVTILPIDVDEDFVREGLSHAVAERIRAALRALDAQAVELSCGGIVDREKWEQAWRELDETRATMEPVLEYARAYIDQWPTDAEEEDDGQD